MKIKINNGDMTINIYDMLEELFKDADPDEIEQLYHTLGWFHPAYIEMIKSAREMTVGENYNSNFFNLFKDFFMFPGRWRDQGQEDVLYCMTQAMEAILMENAKLRIENRRMSILDYKMKGWFKYHFCEFFSLDDLEKFSNEVYSKINELLRYGEEDKNSIKASREMVKQVNHKEFVEEWVDGVYKMFKGEEVENGEG
jgi:hypothetical protein